MENRRLMVFFAAGLGAIGGRKRFADLGVALRKALQQESGQEPAPIATSTTLDAYMFAVSTSMTAEEFGNALMKRLRTPFFFSIDSDHADKLVITELGERKSSQPAQ
jgi:hypothetical protein